MFENHSKSLNLQHRERAQRAKRELFIFIGVFFSYNFCLEDKNAQM